MSETETKKGTIIQLQNVNVVVRHRSVRSGAGPGADAERIGAHPE